MSYSQLIVQIKEIISEEEFGIKGQFRIYFRYIKLGKFIIVENFLEVCSLSLFFWCNEVKKTSIYILQFAN